MAEVRDLDGEEITKLRTFLRHKEKILGVILVVITGILVTIVLEA